MLLYGMQPEGGSMPTGGLSSAKAPGLEIRLTL